MAHRYLEIAADLRERIQKGEFPPDSKLPSLRTFAQHYNVSSAVVNEAEAVLDIEGWIVIRERSGAYVVDRQVQRHRVDWGHKVRRDDLGYIFNAAAGHWSPITTPTRRWEASSSEIAELLNINPGDPVLARFRVVGPGHPVQIATSYFPQDIAAGTVLDQDSTGPGGALDRLEQDMGHGPLSWTAEASTRLPTSQETKALNISERLPVLVITRLSRSASGRPVEVTEFVVDGRTWSIRFPIERDPETATWPLKTLATGENRPDVDASTGKQV